MNLIGLLLCVISVTVSGKVVLKNEESLPDLKWPTKYTFEAEKISLTSGLVEDLKYWRTNTKSRVDYNNGAVKIYKAKPRLSKSGPSFGVAYEVHPETTEEEENNLVCTRTNGSRSSFISLDDILPDVDDFEHVGSENNEVLTEKFSSEFVDYSESEVKQTLWATYSEENKTWTPIRYENTKYNTWLDIAIEHTIWNFFNYDTDFNSSEIFNFEDVYDCQDAEVEPDDDNEPKKVKKSEKAKKAKKSEKAKKEKKSEKEKKEKKLEKAKKSKKSEKAKKNNHKKDNDVDQIFNSFKVKHNIVYSNEEEHALRRNIFKKRMRLVLENNRKNTGYKLAINKFADRTPGEMKRHTGLLRTGKRETDTHPFPYTKTQVKDMASNLPKNFDLRDLGIITPAKDQSSCGSCWTFGTTSAVEGALARKNGGMLIRLSNQALIDCAWGFGASGCNGGSDISAYRWMMVHGLPTEEEYGPYTNRDGFCSIKNMTKTYPIRGYTNVTPLSVEALKVAIVNHGPLSVSIHATETLYLYQGGIYYDLGCSSDARSLNHEVTLVGYGQRDGEDFWIVKNSWGQNWGIDGYLYISMRDNNCGIANEPTYVVI